MERFLLSSRVFLPFLSPRDGWTCVRTPALLATKLQVRICSPSTVFLGGVSFSPPMMTKKHAWNHLIQRAPNAPIGDVQRFARLGFSTTRAKERTNNIRQAGSPTKCRQSGVLLVHRSSAMLVIRRSSVEHTWSLDIEGMGVITSTCVWKRTPEIGWLTLWALRSFKTVVHEKGMIHFAWSQKIVKWQW